MEIISLLVLVTVIALSCFTKVNTGFLSLGFAWILGVYGAKMDIQQILSGFPSHMFLILVGVTYLFGIAKHNGTLERLSMASLHLVKDKPLASPLLFFAMAAALSTAGAGNIGAVALLAPIAMAVAWETRIGALFMTLALICGANAGAFSPFALTGIVANGLIAKLGLPMHPWKDVYSPNFIAQTALLLVCFVFFYIRIKNSNRQLLVPQLSPSALTTGPWNIHQQTTLVTLIIFVLCSVFLKTDIGFLAILLGCMLTLINAGDSKEAVKQIPWSTILMVCGINTLFGILEKLGGIGLLTDMLARISTPESVTAVTAFVSGIISAFSSSSGVVMPTFIPLVPDLIEKIGGGNITAIVSSINVGAHLVDISPLSSLGALCVASTIHEDKDVLFRHLLAIGLSMAIAGAGICYLLFGWM